MIAIASPYNGYVETGDHTDICHNIHKAEEIAKQYWLRGEHVLPLVLTTNYLGPVSVSALLIREQAAKLCKDIIMRCDEVHFYVPKGFPLSPGMEEEMNFCQKYGIPTMVFEVEW